MTIDETPSPIAITKRMESADELLKWLTPHTSRLYGDFLDTDDDGLAAAWIFRGQSNSEWELVPSAQREDAFDDFLHHRGSAHGTLADRRYLELELVKRFLMQADRHGFHIPDETRSSGTPDWAEQRRRARLTLQSSQPFLRRDCSRRLLSHSTTAYPHAFWTGRGNHWSPPTLPLRERRHDAHPSERT